jgi:hypothetical protein
VKLSLSLAKSAPLASIARTGERIGHVAPAFAVKCVSRQFEMEASAVWPLSTSE